jgi:hypothetical protein
MDRHAPLGAPRSSAALGTPGSSPALGPAGSSPPSRTSQARERS